MLLLSLSVLIIRPKASPVQSIHFLAVRKFARFPYESTLKSGILDKKRRGRQTAQPLLFCILFILFPAPRLVSPAEAHTASVPFQNAVSHDCGKSLSFGLLLLYADGGRLRGICPARRAAAPPRFHSPFLSRTMPDGIPAVSQCF